MLINNPGYLRPADVRPSINITGLVVPINELYAFIILLRLGPTFAAREVFQIELCHFFTVYPNGWCSFCGFLSTVAVNNFISVSLLIVRHKERCVLVRVVSFLGDDVTNSWRAWNYY